MAETENVAPEGAAEETFTSAEREYFDSKGEKEAPAVAEVKEIDAEPGQAEPAKTEEEKPERTKVDIAALHEERQRRKETEARLRDAELAQARMEERWQMLQQRSQQQQPPPKPPSPDEDIFGAVNHVINEQRRTAQELAQRRQQDEQARYWNQVGAWARAQETEFKKTAADYDDALAYLRSQRVGELTDLGYNEAVARDRVQQEERELLLDSGRNKRNPAEDAYKLAKRRGYQKKAEQPPADKLDLIEKGQQASKTLSGVGGTSGGGTELTWKELSKLSDSDFDVWINKNPAKWRRLRGAPN